MARAFRNSLIITIPATILPLLFAASAAYAFSWMEFRGRNILFVILVGMLVVPLQLTFIPVLTMFNRLGITNNQYVPFLGIWIAHTGYGLPYAIYLLRNYMGSLPREIFESAYLDGCSHPTAFLRLALPLSVPAIASLVIFQFLFVWNDLLVALIYVGGGQYAPLTYAVSNLVLARRLAPADVGGVRLDGAPADRLPGAAAVLRARHPGRVNQGLMRAAQ